MRIIIGCEESQVVMTAFRNRGLDAYSCDLLPCSGNYPEYHFQSDIFKVLNRERFDLGIFHPPCTYLAGSAVQWLSHPDDKKLPFDARRVHPKYPNRRKDMEESVLFIKRLFNCGIGKIAIENPVGLLSSRWRKPDQIIQPWMFGESADKKTCLWLLNLPKLTPTNIVEKGRRTVFKSGKSHPAWYADILSKARSKEERQRLRSKTFPGIADAMAAQWGNYLLTVSGKTGQTCFSDYKQQRFF
jgi:hypothetical protein